MSPLRPSTPAIRVGSIAAVLILAAAAPATVAAIDAGRATETPDETDESAVGNLSATLPPAAANWSELRSTAAAGRLTPTDSVHPNGTVVFRLNGSTAAESSNGSGLGDDLQFSMEQTEYSTTPERPPLRLNTSESDDAIRTFTVDGDRYVGVDLQNATWEYDVQPGTSRLEPRPRVAHGYVTTLSITTNGTTVSRNTTIHMTEPEVSGDVQVDVGNAAELTVGMPGTWTATLVVGNESVGHRAALQVVDADADGKVTVRVDTDASELGAVFTAAGPDTVRRHPADDGFTTWNGTLSPGRYQLGAGVADQQTVAEDRYDWGPALTVVESTPTPTAATPTATAAATPTQTETPTETVTPTDTVTKTGSPTPTTTQSPGFGSVTTLLAVVVTLLVAGSIRTES